MDEYVSGNHRKTLFMRTGVLLYMMRTSGNVNHYLDQDITGEGAERQT